MFIFPETRVEKTETVGWFYIHVKTLLPCGKTLLEQKKNTQTCFVHFEKQIVMNPSTASRATQIIPNIQDVV